MANHAVRTLMSSAQPDASSVRDYGAGRVKLLECEQSHCDSKPCIFADAYALPVEGTETRVNAQSEAYEYVVDFGETSKVKPCVICRTAHERVAEE